MMRLAKTGGHISLRILKTSMAIVLILLMCKLGKPFFFLFFFFVRDLHKNC